MTATVESINEVSDIHDAVSRPYIHSVCTDKNKMTSRTTVPIKLRYQKNGKQIWLAYSTFYSDFQHLHCAPFSIFRQLRRVTSVTEFMYVLCTGEYRFGSSSLEPILPLNSRPHIVDHCHLDA